MPATRQPHGLRRHPLALAVALALAASSAAAVPVTLVGGNGSYWDIAGNWSPGLPSLPDDVLLGAFDSVFRQGAVSVNSFTGSGQLQLTGGLLSVSAASSIGSLLLDAGGLAGSGTVAAGTLAWNGGSFGEYAQGTPLQINVAGAATLGGSGTLFLLGGANLHLGGGSSWAAGSGTLYVQGLAGASTVASRLVIASGASFDDLGNGAGNRSIANYAGNGAAVDVMGSFVKSAGSGATSVGILFNNSGSTRVLAGTLGLDGGGSSSASFETAAGATLRFGGGTHTLSGASFANAGTVAVTAGMVDIVGNNTVSGSGSFAVQGGTLNVQGTLGPAVNLVLGVSGTITGAGSVNAGSFSWEGGSVGAYAVDTPVGIRVAGSTTLEGASGKFLLGGATLELNGNSTWLAGGAPIYLQGLAGNTAAPSRLSIGAGASFDDQGNGSSSRSIANYAGTGALVANAGSFVKSAGSGTTNVAITFDNSGTVNALAGTLSLDGGGSSSGSFQAGLGATLNFGGGNHLLNGASFVNAGTVSVSSGIVTLAGSTSYSGSGNLAVVGGQLEVQGTLGPAANVLLAAGGVVKGAGTVNAGGFSWNGGTLGVYAEDTPLQMTVSGTATLDGANTQFLLGGARLSLNGSSTWTAGGSVIYVQGLAGSSAAPSRLHIGAGGNFDDRGNGSGNRSIANYAGSGALVANAGSFVKSGGSGTTSVVIAFDNTGTVNAQAGTLSLDGGGSSSGSFQAGLGATLNFGGGNHLLNGASFVNAGTVSVSGGSVNLAGSTSYSGSGNLAVNAGRLDVQGTLGPAANVLLSGSGLIGGAGTVNAGSFTWNGGSVGAYPEDTPLLFAVSGAAALDGPNTKIVAGGATLALNGASAWAPGSGPLYVQGVAGSSSQASRLLVGAAGVLDDQGNGASSRTIANYAGAGARVDVAGTYRKSSGNGSTQVTIAFNNSGTVDVLAGTLALDGGGTASGRFVASSGAATVLGAGYTLGNGTRFSGAGELALGGNVTVVGTVANDGPGVFALRSGAVLAGSGRVDTDALNWAGGQVGVYAEATPSRLNVSGAATLDGANSKIIAGGAEVTLAGASTWHSGGSQLYLQGLGGSSTAASRLVIPAGASFDDQGNGASTRSIATYAFSGAAIDVAGSYLKSAGSGTTQVSGLRFNNSGIVDVRAGVLSLEGGGTASGSFVASLGAATQLGGGYVLGDGTRFAGAGALAISGSAVAVGTTAHNGPALFAIRSGGSLGGTGTVQTDAFAWTGGDLGVYAADTQTKLNVAGAATLDGATGKSLLGGATLMLNGATTWQAGGAPLYMQGVGASTVVPSRLLIGSGATFDDQGFGANERGISAYGYNGAVVDVVGTYRKSAGSGITRVGGTRFNNSGTVDVQNGVLALDGGGTSSGSFAAALGAATQLGGGYVLGHGTRFSGAGELAVTGSVSASGTTTNENAAVFAIRSGGSLGGTGLVQTDALRWSGGDLGVYAADTPVRLTVAGNATLDGATSKFVLGGATMSLGGASTWQSGGAPIYLQGVGSGTPVPSRLLIAAGATFDDQGNGASARSIAAYGYSDGIVEVSGTYLKSAGSGSTQVTGTRFDNFGTVEVRAGVLSLEGGGRSTGSFVAALGAATQLGGGYLLDNGTRFSGAGELVIAASVAASGATANAGPATLALRNGGQLAGSGSVSTDALRWGGGNVGAYAENSPVTLNASGAATLDGSNALFVLGGATVTLGGTSTWQAGGSALYLQGVGGGSTQASRLVIASGGSFVDQGNGGGGRSITGYGYNGGEVINAGSWLKSGGSGTTIIYSTLFSNTGTVAVSAGRFSLQGGFSNFSGSTLSGGSYIVTGAGSTFSFSGADIATNAATIVLDGAGSALLNDSTGSDALANFASNAAPAGFTIRNGRNFTSAGNFGNAGTVNVGSASLFSTSGNFDNQAGATLQLAGGSFAATALASAGTVAGFGTLLPAVQNSGLVRASGGTLVASQGVLGNSGDITIDSGATLNLAGATGGSTVRVLADAGSLNLGAQNLTVFKDYDNAGFGSGNSFAARAGVTGTGQIIGNGAAMVIAGQVTAGAANSYTLDLGNVRGGTSVTRSFQVANSGSGADIRGALQTAAPGLGSISDARLSGSGVVAGNFGPIAAGANSGSFSVTLAAGSSGGALAGQSLGVVGNFGNLAPQAIAIAGFTTVLAQGAVAPAGPLDLGNFRVGIPPAASGSLSASNLTSGAGAERLAISGLSTSGNFAAVNNLGAGFVAPGASFADAVGVATAGGVAGLNNGSVTVQFGTNGQLVDPGFTTQAANQQTVNLAARGYLVAQPALPASAVQVGNFRVSTGASSSFAIVNTAAAPAGFQELLNASAGTAGAGVTLAGSFNGLAPGASNNNLVIGFAPGGVGGPRSGSALVDLVSDGVGSSNLGLYTLGSGSVGVAGTAYNLAQGAATPSPLLVPNQREGGFGGAASVVLVVGNVAPAGIYSEALNAGFAGSTGSATTNGGSFVDLLAGGVNSTALVVSVNNGAAGTRSGSVTLAFQSDGSGANGRSGLAPVAAGTQVINVSGSVYRLASASALAPPGPIVLPNQRVGGSLTQGLAITNTAATDGFSEALNVGVVAGGTAIGGGGFLQLAPGATSNTLFVGVDTFAAGLRGGSVSFNLASDGSGSSGFAPLGIGSQQVQVSGSVYRLATANLIAPLAQLADQRVGGALTAPLAITNVSQADGFSESLLATATADASTTAAGNFVLLGAGATSNALTVGVNTNAPGLIGGTVTVSFASSGLGTSGLPTVANGAQAVPVQGRVFLPAVASVAPAALVLPAQRVGGQDSLTLPFQNVQVVPAAGAQYVERLDGSIVALNNQVTVGGNFSFLNPGAPANNNLFVGVDTTSAGAKAGTVRVDFLSTGQGGPAGQPPQLNNLAPLPLASQVVGVSGDVYRLAVPVVDNTTITLAARVGAVSPSQAVFVANDPVGVDLYTERLNARWGAPVPAGFSLGGAIVGLPATQSSSALNVTLVTSTAGSFQGNAVIDRVSSGVGTTGAPDAPLGATLVPVVGRVWAPAVPVVAPAIVDFGIVRVGDTVAARTLTASNSNVGALTDSLNASFATAAGPFTTGGSVSGLASGQSNATALTVQLATGAAGVYQTATSVALSSTNTDLAPLLLPSAEVTLRATVNRYAQGTLDRTGGDGQLITIGPGQLRLDFGTLVEGSGAATALLALANPVAAPADALRGSWDLSGLTGGAFSLGGFGSFLLAPGASSGLSVSLLDAALGSYDQTVWLRSASVNGFGADFDFQPVELRLTGTVVAVPEPATYALMLAGAFAVLAWTRRRLRVQQGQG